MKKTLATLAVLGMLALPAKVNAAEDYTYYTYKHIVDGDLEIETISLTDGRKIIRSRGTFAEGTILYQEWVPNKEGKLEEKEEILDWNGDGTFDNGYEFGYENGYDDKKITDKIEGQKILDKLKAYFDFI